MLTLFLKLKILHEWYYLYLTNKQTTIVIYIGFPRTVHRTKLLVSIVVIHHMSLILSFVPDLLLYAMSHFLAACVHAYDCK